MQWGSIEGVIDLRKEAEIQDNFWVYEVKEYIVAGIGA